MISARSYLETGDNQDAVDAIIGLTEKIEVSSYVQSNEFIAVAGMQGTGKTTIISCLYDLPVGILDINIGRSERVPVFISEDVNLKQGEYRAECVTVDEVSGSLIREQLESVEDVADYSKGWRRAAFVELYVPSRYNAKFVLLPGFEKNEDRNFNSLYNSLMDYTLHFAKAVLLVVDDVGLANKDIQHLISILGEKFSPSNCVFAISKCDLKTEHETEELKKTLLDECLKSDLKINENQIVCTKGEASREWHQKLMSCIEDNFDYNASKKNYTFFRPMAEEIRSCAVRIKEDLTVKENSAQVEDKPVYYDVFKKALKEERKVIKSKLERICDTEKAAVYEDFIIAYDSIDKRHKKDKKFAFINKTEKEKLEDRQVIMEVAKKCLYDNSSPKKSRFVKAVKTAAESEIRDGYADIEENYWENAIACLKCENLNKDEAKLKISTANKAVIASIFDSAVPIPIMEKGSFAGYEQIAAVVAYELKAFYYGMLADYNGKESKIRPGTKVEQVSKLMKKDIKKHGAVKIIAALDMIDGSPDIAKAFVGIGEAFGIGAAMPYVAAVAALGAAGTLGINIYNNIIDQQNMLCRTWGYSLQNSVEEEKEALLEAYDSACDKLLEHICDVHKARNRVDDTIYRLNIAKYAAEDMIHLVADMDSEYAVRLES